MRPIDRGTIPKEKGIDKTVSNYTHWRKDLIDRIGSYCSYCNMKITFSPQVEHVSPKSLDPTRKVDWTNMLLACGPCNLTKSDKPTSHTTHLLPDMHNTHLAFAYIEKVFRRKGETYDGAIAIPSTSLVKGSVEETMAKATIELVGLDILKVNNRATDYRWKERYEAIIHVRSARQCWGEAPKKDNMLIDNICFQAQSRGFFSIWYRAFEDVPEMREALIKAFNGTSQRHFSQVDYLPVPPIV